MPPMNRHHRYHANYCVNCGTRLVDKTYGLAGTMRECPKCHWVQPYDPERNLFY